MKQSIDPSLLVVGVSLLLVAAWCDVAVARTFYVADNPILLQDYVLNEATLLVIAIYGGWLLILTSMESLAGAYRTR
jgi:hypothetical protein